MKIFHISLDTETWGTTPGSDIRSIGAVLFDPTIGRIIDTFYGACANPLIHNIEGVRLTYDLKRDPQTEKWWRDQTADAQAAFSDPGDLREVLRRMTLWIDGCAYLPGDRGKPNARTNVRIWCHGANFDPPIVSAALAACGLAEAWHYRAPRDTRTLFDAAGIEDHSEWLKKHPGPLGIPHHALDDAHSQALAISAAWRIIWDGR
jgi:hypothetical protein